MFIFEGLYYFEFMSERGGGKEKGVAIKLL